MVFASTTRAQLKKTNQYVHGTIVKINCIRPSFHSREVRLIITEHLEFSQVLSLFNLEKIFEYFCLKNQNIYYLISSETF